MRLLLTITFYLWAIHSTKTIAADSPNIILIVADDLAWADLACYGHPWHETRHLDSLAREGMRFLNGYAPAPICSASRASILTGMTTARLNFEFVTKNEPGTQKIDGDVPLRTPPYTLNLPLEVTTIPEYLGELGYETAFFGKWHLNAHYQRYLGWSPTHGPRQQGFDIAEEDFGSHPYGWSKPAPATIKAKGEFPVDSMTDRVVHAIRRHRERPFFLMASQFFVHTPVRSRCQWLFDKYDQRIPKDSPNRERRIAYAAFIEELDHQVGVILEAVNAAGLRDTTLVVFTSDNGGHPEYTANGPLRGSKWNLYEGGIRVPLIARWPHHIKAESTCEVPVVGYDLLPTFVEVAGGIAKGVDGTSLVPWLKSPDRPMVRELVWHFPYYHPESGYHVARESIGRDDFEVSKTRPHSALRRGDHKLLFFYEDERTELYHLGDDPGEQRDLSRSQGKLTASLLRLLQEQLLEFKARIPIHSQE